MSRFNLSALAVKEGSVTLFLILTIAVAGVLAFLTLGRAEDPSFTVKVMTVSAAWPGATAEEMQNLVAEPLEKRLQELKWYDRVETFTRPGLVFMTLNLKSSTPKEMVQEEFYQARKKMGDEKLKLPGGVAGPYLNDEYSDVSFALYAVKAPQMPPRLLARRAEELRQRLLHVPGTMKVNIIGERPERIYVEFSKDKLATLGVTPEAIFEAIGKRNMLSPAGSVETHGPQIFVRLEGAYGQLEELRETPVVSGGRSFKLEDVAEVQRGYEDPPSLLIRHNGEEAIVLGVVMKEGWNGLDLGKALEKEAADITSELPAGVSFAKITDQSVNITHAVDEFMLKFWAALAVVLLVSLVSLGWRVGLVVAAAVPLTLAAVFVVMAAWGKVFDRITLGALILSLGLLVDDAIIAIEMMVVKMEEGMERTKAAAYAWTVTAGPMLSGTVLTAIGLMPVGFAKSDAGEYAGNIFWIVGTALIVSWLVAVIFTPYLGVKMLPDLKPVEGGHHAIYSTPNYNRLRRMIQWGVKRKFTTAALVGILFFCAVAGMGKVKQQFFPVSERPELIVETRLPAGSSIEVTERSTKKLEAWLKQQPEAEVVTTYIGQGAPRFFLSLGPELPDPAFAKTIILTPDGKARDHLKERLRGALAEGLVAEARMRVTQLLFGPYVQFPVMFRVMGPEPGKLREIADEVKKVMEANPHMRDVQRDWGDLAPVLKFRFNHERLEAIGMSQKDASDQLQFHLNGVTVTSVREDIRSVDVVARSSGWNRLDPARISDLTFVTREGRSIPVDQVGQIEVSAEDPILRRRDRTPTITVEGDINEALQPPQVTGEVLKALEPVISKLPPDYRIETGGTVEESLKSSVALAKIFPVMIVLTLIVIMLQVRSFSAMVMVFLTGPLGLVGTVPMLLIFNQPFGFNAILGLIGLSGILMRNTLILVGQIHENMIAGMSSYEAVIEATVQRARPVLLTALAAVLAFTPLTHSSFWGPMAYTLIGGTAVGTVLTLLFLPALYAIWFGVKPPVMTEA